MGLMYAGMLLWAVWGNEKKVFLRFEKGPAGWLGDMFFAGVVGLGVCGVSYWLSQNTKIFAEFEKKISGWLGDLSVLDIFFISIFSAISEEFFFRGFVLSHVGLGGSSLLFGLLHVGPGKAFLPWTFFAVLMGFFCGALYLWFDNIFVPVGVHFTVNVINLMVLTQSKSIKAHEDLI